jgi:hypothetical protein
MTDGLIVMARGVGPPKTSQIKEGPSRPEAQPIAGLPLDHTRSEDLDAGKDFTAGDALLRAS